MPVDISDLSTEQIEKLARIQSQLKELGFVIENDDIRHLLRTDNKEVDSSKLGENKVDEDTATMDHDGNGGTATFRIPKNSTKNVSMDYVSPLSRLNDDNGLRGGDGLRGGGKFYKRRDSVGE